jgi:hypothetical protein
MITNAMKGGGTTKRQELTAPSGGVSALSVPSNPGRPGETNDKEDASLVEVDQTGEFEVAPRHGN